MTINICSVEAMLRSLKMILNFENSYFFTALTKKVLQAIKQSFEYSHEDIKIYEILPVTTLISTTVTTQGCAF